MRGTERATLATFASLSQNLSPNSDRMNAPFMGNRYLLLNVKLEVLGFGHIGELQLHLKDMWELSDMRPSNEPNDKFSLHADSDRLASLDGRGPFPDSRLASAAPSTAGERGAQQDVGAVDRRESGPLGQLPPIPGVPAESGAEQRSAPLMDPEKLRRLRRRQDTSRRQQVEGQVGRGAIISGNQLDQDRGRTI